MIYRARRVYGLFTVVLLGLFLASCGSPEVRTLVSMSPAEEYAAFLRTKIAADKNFDFGTLSSDLIVKALFYSPEVETRARLLFHGDPLFNREADAWRAAAAADSSKTRVVVLMGLFAPDLGEKDLADGRFRPGLALADGQIARASDIVRYGRDCPLARDYFPAFDPWEELYAVKFDLPKGASDVREFILEWPGGVRRLDISSAGAAAPPAAPQP